MRSSIVPDTKCQGYRRPRHHSCRGSLLERDVARIFSLIGLRPSLNVRLDGHEIDILVAYDGMKIAVECKQYESGRLGVRDLIYEWATKKRELGLDKVLLVIVGCEVKPVNKMLTSKHGIAIWDENDFERFFTKAIEYREVAKDDVLRSIGIEPPMRLTKSSAEQELVEELLQPVAEEALRPAELGFYEMMKLVALLWIFLGWIFMVLWLYSPRLLSPKLSQCGS